MRDRAMFDLAIDSKLRGCDIVKIKIGDIVLGGRVRSRAIVVQQKTKRPVQFELLDHAQGSLKAWLDRRGGAVPGRDAPFGAPPGQIRTSGIPASGSYLGCLTAKRTLGQGWRMRGDGSQSPISFAMRFHVSASF